MRSRALLAVVRLGFAGLAVFAITVQLVDLAAKGTLNPVNFFSYFTIQSNLIAVAALVLPAVATLAARGGQARRFDMLRGPPSCTWPSPAWSTGSCSRTRTSTRRSPG